MANETIAIYFKPMFAGFHETIVYTDASGAQYYLNAYATNSDYRPTDYSGLAQDVALARADVITNTPSIWGTLATSGSVQFDISDASAKGITTDNPNDPSATYASVTVAAGSNLKSLFDGMVAEEQTLASKNLTYSVTAQNSNSMASTAMLAVGIEPPDTGPLGSHWAIASDNVLDPSLPFRLPKALSGAMEAVLDIFVAKAYGNEIPPLTTMPDPVNGSILTSPIGAGNVTVDPTTRPSSSTFIDFTNPNTAVLKAGGTLSDIVAIANANGNNISLDDLRRINGLTPDMDGNFQIGQQLIVPTKVGADLSVNFGDVLYTVNTINNDYSYTGFNSFTNTNFGFTHSTVNGLTTDQNVEMDLAGHVFNINWSKSDGSSGSYLYDTNGNVIKSLDTDASGNTTRVDTKYDGNGGWQRVTTFPDGTTAEAGVSVNATDGSTTNYQYNPDGSFTLNTTDSAGVPLSNYGLTNSTDGTINYQWLTTDSSGSFSTVNGNSIQQNIYPNGDSVVIATSSDGATSTTSYDATTKLYAVHSVSAEGLVTDEVIAPDGSAPVAITQNSTATNNSSTNSYSWTAGGQTTTTSSLLSGNGLFTTTFVLPDGMKVVETMNPNGTTTSQNFNSSGQPVGQPVTVGEDHLDQVVGNFLDKTYGRVVNAVYSGLSSIGNSIASVFGWPVVLDLNGDGLNLVDLTNSTASFDMSGNGQQLRTSWVGPTDGILAYDIDANGVISQRNEISFRDYLPGATTDLEGLAAFDTNHDGIISALDAEWNKFGVWQDTNQNGVCEAGEFKSLTDMGIMSVSLQSNNQAVVSGSSVILGTTQFARADGSSGIVGDVALSYATSNTSVNIAYGTLGNDVMVGTVGNDTLISGSGNDTIFGKEGNDILIGGGGADTMYGGTGSDIYYVSDATDKVIENPGEGIDTVVVSYPGSGYVLPDNVEVLKLEGSATYGTGNNLDNILIGNDLGDYLTGGGGNDTLSSGSGNDSLDGGVGMDSMSGGAGNDIYYVDNAGDVVIENANEGSDTVESSVSYMLGANVENLVLTGSANINGIGNELDNVLIGNSGNNILIGGLGNDTYYVDNVGDVVIEGVNAGKDTVVSSISYELGANVEGLNLSGTSNINGKGNELNNVLNGNAGDNVLEGGAGDDFLDGGSGADTLIGGTGNDSYVVRDSRAVIIENANEGMDVVRSFVSYTLSDNVEVLALMVNSYNPSAADSINGTGNSGDNTIIGNSGDNVLDGGAGNDLLISGGGNDTYIFGVGRGQDIVASSAFRVGGIVQMVGGLTSKNVTATRGRMKSIGVASNDLILAINGTSDTLTIEDYFSNPLTEIRFADATLDISNFQNLSASTNGSAGDDFIYGSDGIDIINGGKGNDILYGGTGNDIYVFNLGDGQDKIIDSDATVGNVDTLRFGTGISANDIEFGWVGLDLVLSIKGTKDQVTIGYWKYGDASHIERVEYADGTVWDSAYLQTQATATPISGTSGNDILRGDIGNNTYLFGLGGGQDTILDWDATSGNVDTLRFGAGIKASDITFSWNGNSLVLGINGTADQVTIHNWQFGDAYHIERVEFADGTTWDSAYLQTASTALIVGTSSNDYLRGGIGNNTYLFDLGGGQDTISDYDGTIGNIDTLRFGAGISASDITFSCVSSDLVLAINGTNDQVTIRNWKYGDAYHIERVEFADGAVWDSAYLLAQATALLPISGTSGNDILRGDIGNNTYLFNLGGGQDTIVDYDGTIGNVDTLRFGTGITASDITLSCVGSDLVLAINGTNDQVTIHNWKYGDAYHIERVEFADGAVWDSAYLQTQAIAAPISGTSGNDILRGDIGNNTYLFGLGGGQDTIVDWDATNGNVDTLRFGAGITSSDIKFSWDGSSLVLGINGTTDQVTIHNWKFGDANHIERVEFADGAVWDKTYLQAQISAITITGTNGNDTLYGDSGNNTFQGGTGNDLLIGGMGNDTYLFNLGDGQDAISENDATIGNVDTLRFGAGIATSDIAFSLTGDGLVLSINGTNDQVKILGWENGVENRIERVEFADGSVWDSAYLQTRIVATTVFGTSGDDYLLWDSGGNDTIDGGAGNDYLNAGLGSDTYIFNLGGGQDTIADSGNAAGNIDTLRFGAGITASDMIFTQNGTSLTLSINGTSDRVSILKSGDAYCIERVQFADGTTWDSAYIQSACCGTSNFRNER